MSLCVTVCHCVSLCVTVSGAVGAGLLVAGWSARCKCCGYRGLVLWGSLGGLRGVSVVVTEVWCCGARWVVCEV